MSDAKTPMTTKPIPMDAASSGKAAAKTPAAASKKSKPPARPGSEEEAEVSTRPSKLGGAFVVKGALVWQNIAMIFAALLLWVSWRYLFVAIHWGDALRFRPYDVLFALAMPCAAFGMNCYWLREQRTDVITKWSVTWAIIALVIFLSAAFFGAGPLHQVFMELVNKPAG